MLRAHFACDENAPRAGTAAGAVMVFTSMRNAVTDICERLNGLEGTHMKARCGVFKLHARPYLPHVVVVSAAPSRGRAGECRELGSGGWATLRILTIFLFGCKEFIIMLQFSELFAQLGGASGTVNVIV